MIREWTRSTASGFLMVTLFLVLYALSGFGLYRAVMVEMALDMLSKSTQVKLDEERKAAMVSNLLVVLCADREAQPVVNTGTLYH